MRIFFVFVFVLVSVRLLLPMSAYAAETPKIMIPDPFVDPEPAIPGYNYWQAEIMHIAISKPFFYSKQDENIYIGVEFPLYCGYMELTEDRRITFIKKTSLPIKRIAFFFEDIKMLGGVPADEIAMSTYGVDSVVPLTNDYAYKILMDNMMWRNIHIIKTFPPGEGKDFVPKFKQMYPYIPGKLPPDTYKYLKLAN